MTARAWQGAIGFVIATLAGAVVVTLRQQGTSVLDSMWAEDGSVFLQGALEQDPGGTLLLPYRGYVLVSARLIAAVASLVPIEYAAAVMAGSAALIVGAIAAFTYVASADLIASRGLRALLAASVVLTPVARIESLGNVANLHFYLVFAAFWALIWVPRWRAGVIASCVVVALAALSDPLVAVLVPVAIARWFVARDWSGRAPIVVGAVALAVQAIAVIQASGMVTNPPTMPDPIAIASLYPIRVVGGALLGLQGTGGLWPSVGGWLIAAGTLVLAAGAVYIGGRSDLRGRAIVLLCLGISLASFVASMWLRWDPDLAPAADDQFLRLGVRYLLVPVLFLLTAVAVLLDRPDPRVAAGVWTKGTLVVLGLIIATWVVDFSGPNARTDAPSWTATVAAARTACAAGGPTTVDLPIAPRGWVMTLPCPVLLR